MKRDERCVPSFFQADNKQNIAFYQSITFREYLAAAAGEPLPPYTGYKPDVNPGIDPVFCIVQTYRPR